MKDVADSPIGFLKNIFCLKSMLLTKTTQYSDVFLCLDWP